MARKTIIAVLLIGVLLIEGCCTSHNDESVAGAAKGSEVQREDVQRANRYTLAIRQGYTDIAALLLHLERYRGRLSPNHRKEHDEWVRRDLTDALISSLDEARRILAKMEYHYDTVFLSDSEDRK